MITMKNVFIMRYFFILFFGLFSYSCSNLTKFNLYYSQEITVSPGMGIGVPFTSSTPPFPTQSTTQFENNNTNADLIESCKLVELIAQITQPANYDFSFLNQAEIFVSAPYLQEVKVAQIYNIPDNVGKELKFETTNVELLEYIKKEQLQIRIATVQDKITLEEVKAMVNMKFLVDAKILGL